LKDGTLDLDWPSLCRPKQTVVIYMGLGALTEICRQLIAQGLSPDLPGAVIMNGTQVDQKVVTGTLQTLPEQVAAAGLKSPSLIIIGDVVKLRDKLTWFGGV
jgi:uroporphyrin-III C-methyltransferase/precorrin-2 dehydrogenase/sirohydrochlorin ferrochelatase